MSLFCISCVHLCVIIKCASRRQLQDNVPKKYMRALVCSHVHMHGTASLHNSLGAGPIQVALCTLQVRPHFSIIPLAHTDASFLLVCLSCLISAVT